MQQLVATTKKQEMVGYCGFLYARISKTQNHQTPHHNTSKPKSSHQPTTYNTKHIIFNRITPRLHIQTKKSPAIFANATKSFTISHALSNPHPNTSHHQHKSTTSHNTLHYAQYMSPNT